MNGVVLYQSKYGATKKYAEWISEKTGFPVIETKKAKIGDIKKYDNIDTVLDILSRTGDIRFSRKGNTITIVSR